MAIKIEKDSKLIKVLADQARGERVDSANAEEAAQIISELAQDLTPDNRHQIAQTIGFTVQELQQKSLNFLDLIADQKTVGYKENAAFNVKTRGIKAYWQAKGSTTARSYVAGKQILVETDEISARPAINIVDLRSGRVNMADLIRQANQEMTNKKLMKVEAALHAAVQNYSTPFYGTGTGIDKTVLDTELNYFRRLGPVTILGDIAAVGQMASLVGMQMDGNGTYMSRSGDALNEYNNNGYIGKYLGANVLSMDNTYEAGQTTPILSPDWLYIIPGNVQGDYRNLKIVNEGAINAVEAQDINDMVFEVRLDQWFGAAFVAGETPTIGAYLIG